MAVHEAPYAMPPGVHAIPPTLLDLRSDHEIDKNLLNPPPVTSEKNVWFYWDKGYSNMHPYAQRNIRAWHRRLSPLGWTIRVVDISDSPRGSGHISNFLDTADPNLFPRSYHENTIDGDWRGQLTSDLSRFPLLLVHGGIYADVTLLQVGDVDRLWNETIMNPNSPFEFLCYHLGRPQDAYYPFNFFMVTRPNNPFLARSNRLLLTLWGRDGGRTNSPGMVKDPLMVGAPSPFPVDEKGQSMRMFFRSGNYDEFIANTVDYGIQMNVMALVMGLVDEEDNWNGPEYTCKHIWALPFENSALLDFMTQFNGQRAFDLLSLPIPNNGEMESEDQKLARELVETTLQRGFALKLAHGPIAKIVGDTLGILWRRNVGSDDVVGTYAHWLRYAMIHWTQDELPERMPYDLRAPCKVGGLLKA